MNAPDTLFSEDDLLPLSGLQHLMFCERQWALIHVESAWAENRLTVEGHHLHEKVHALGDETRGGVRTARGLRLRSLRLGLSGQADVVEFHRDNLGEETPFPVEYKRGRPKPDRCDEVQLCAQAMCLEEMLAVDIPRGAIFYGQPRRRHDVILGDALRAETVAAARRMHALFSVAATPPAQYAAKCDNCSLCGLCMPKSTEKGKSASVYLDSLWKDIE